MPSRYTPGLDSTAILVKQKREAAERLRRQRKQPAGTQIVYSVNPDGTVTASYGPIPASRRYGRGE